MSEEYIPDYTRYKSADLLDVYSRIEKQYTPKHYEALVAEIRRRFNIEGEIDLSDGKIVSKITTKVQEDKLGSPSKTANRKEYYLLKKFNKIFTVANLPFGIYMLYIGEYNTLLRIYLFILPLLGLTDFIIGLRTGITNNRPGLFSSEKDDIYQEKNPNKFWMVQIRYLLISLFSLTIGILTLLGIIPLAD